MPQATEKLRARWADDSAALDQLKGNFACQRGILIPNQGYAPTADDLSALEYLFQEWDYGVMLGTSQEIADWLDVETLSRALTLMGVACPEGGLAALANKAAEYINHLTRQIAKQQPAKDRRYEVVIELAEDRGVHGLMFAGKKGGYRITSGKASGSWRHVRAFVCRFSQSELDKYDRAKRCAPPAPGASPLVEQA